MSCALCEERKEKRFCPAVHGKICPQCCGEQREVTLDCPSDCPYLQQARSHEKPRSVEELAAAGAELFPEVEFSQRFTYEQEPLIAGLCSGLARVARADRQVRDRDVIAALANLAHSYQRLADSGLQYEAAPTDAGQMAITSEIHRMVAEYRGLEQQHLGHSRLRDADVLRALVFLLRMAHTRTSGRARSHAFLEFLFGIFPEKAASAITAPNHPASRIIIP